MVPKPVTFASQDNRCGNASVLANVCVTTLHYCTFPIPVKCIETLLRSFNRGVLVSLKTRSGTFYKNRDYFRYDFRLERLVKQNPEKHHVLTYSKSMVHTKNR
uniref:Uncharacterized protein n=1 Tax=Cacopsylla melanoneura TaxID=428564 RepID=A0A8D9DXP5_9HEMI